MAGVMAVEPLLRASLRSGGFWRLPRNEEIIIFASGVFPLGAPGCKAAGASATARALSVRMLGGVSYTAPIEITAMLTTRGPSHRRQQGHTHLAVGSPPAVVAACPWPLVTQVLQLRRARATAVPACSSRPGRRRRRRLCCRRSRSGWS